MVRLRFDLYTGRADEPKFTFKNSWQSLAGETVEELAERIKQQVIEDADCLLNEDMGDEYDDEDN